MAFVLFRHKSTGVVASYPEHYATHPVFGPDLELFDNTGEYEEDKVVVGGHETPVEMRAQVVAVKLEDLNVTELKDILNERGLSTSGNKQELIDRIVADNNTEEI
jgi:hypothetical protein